MQPKYSVAVNTQPFACFCYLRLRLLPLSLICTNCSVDVNENSLYLPSSELQTTSNGANYNSFTCVLVQEFVNAENTTAVNLLTLLDGNVCPVGAAAKVAQTAG